MGLSLTYCADTMDAQVQGSHAHGANDIRHDKAALRVDRALSALENVMSQTPGANKKLRKDLQKIHSDLMSAQRALEK